MTKSDEKCTSRIYKGIFKDVIDGTASVDKKMVLGLKFFDENALDYSTVGIKLRRASEEDMENLARIDTICFGEPEAEEDREADVDEDLLGCEDIYNVTFIAELNEVIIGKVDTIMEGTDGYIYGFCILPQYRRFGYGKEFVYLTLEEFRSEKIEAVILEVAEENRPAVELYKGCGFREINMDNLSAYL